MNTKEQILMRQQSPAAGPSHQDTGQDPHRSLAITIAYLAAALIGLERAAASTRWTGEWEARRW